MGFQNTLYVTGFGKNINAESLAPFFDKFGEIVRVDIPPTKTPDGPPYAFVEFEKEEDFRRALEELTSNPVILDEEDRYHSTYPPKENSGEGESKEEAEPAGALKVQEARSTPHPPRGQQRGYRRGRGGYGRGGYSRGAYGGYRGGPRGYEGGRGAYRGGPRGYDGYGGRDGPRGYSRGGYGRGGYRDRYRDDGPRGRDERDHDDYDAPRGRSEGPDEYGGSRGRSEGRDERRDDYREEGRRDDYRDEGRRDDYRDDRQRERSPSRGYDDRYDERYD